MQSIHPGEFDVFLPPFEIEEVIVGRSLSATPSWGVDYLNVPEAWKRTRGKGVIVFVIDTEDSTTHPDVISSVVPQYCRRITNEPATTITGAGHGLHVAHTIKQVAPDVKIGFVKGLTNEGSGYSTWIADCIKFVADVPLLPEHQGYIKLINMSLGSNTPSPAIKEALAYALSNGVKAIFAAAGNDGAAVDFPGAFDAYCVAVGAVDIAGNVADFSSKGPEVNLVAPGVNIIAAWKNGYAGLSGTSMATPHVTGIGALIVSLVREIALEFFMTDRATDIGVPGKDDQSGFGLPIATNYIDTTTPVDPEPDPDNPPITTKPKIPGWIIIGGIALVIVAAYLVIRYL